MGEVCRQLRLHQYEIRLLKQKVSLLQSRVIGLAGLEMRVGQMEALASAEQLATRSSARPCRGRMSGDTAPMHGCGSQDFCNDCGGFLQNIKVEPEGDHTHHANEAMNGSSGLTSSYGNSCSATVAELAFDSLFMVGQELTSSTLDSLVNSVNAGGCLNGANPEFVVLEDSLEDLSGIPGLRESECTNRNVMATDNNNDSLSNVEFTDFTNIDPLEAGQKEISENASNDSIARTRRANQAQLARGKKKRKKVSVRKRLSLPKKKRCKPILPQVSDQHLISQCAESPSLTADDGSSKTCPTDEELSNIEDNEAISVGHQAAPNFLIKVMGDQVREVTMLTPCSDGGLQEGRRFSEDNTAGVRQAGSAVEKLRQSSDVPKPMPTKKKVSDYASVRRIRCDECGLSLQGNSSLRRHINVVHEGKDSHLNKCAACGARFNHLYMLEQHDPRCRKKRKKFTCTQCKRSFCSRLRFETHKKKHQENKFKCPQCPQTFVRKNSLILHGKSHNPQRKPCAANKAVACEVCGKVIAKRSSLKLHMRKHTQKKNFKCQVCQKKFAWPRALSAHVKLNHGVDPHTCTVCGCGFPSISLLMIHARSHMGSPRLSTTTKGRRSAAGLKDS